MFNIVACNLRSRIYGLSEIDSLYAQMITVKIDFSISTTTSICSASMFTEFHVSLMPSVMALEEVLAESVNRTSFIRVVQRKRDASNKIWKDR